MWNGQWDGVELWPSPGPSAGSTEFPLLKLLEPHPGPEVLSYTSQLFMVAGDKRLIHSNGQDRL